VHNLTVYATDASGNTDTFKNNPPYNSRGIRDFSDNACCGRFWSVSCYHRHELAGALQASQSLSVTFAKKA
jgi:hypothetical protein